LEKALGIPADIWMNLQTQYDLDTANIAERDTLALALEEQQSDVISQDTIQTLK
jgi:plasmid maintenance system antidote protein VapI